jgi:hypothetical protein
MRISVGMFALVILGAVAPAASARQLPALRVENFYPHQAPPGQTTLLTFVVTSRQAVQRAEITPSDGITVVDVRGRGGVQGNTAWAEVQLQVARDAAPGPRTLVLELATGRTAPVTITIPDHAPRIADLRRPTSSISSGVDVLLTATDPSADLGELPYVWFTIGCKGEVEHAARRAADIPGLRGVVRGKAQTLRGGGSAVHAILPRPAAPEGMCDLQVRVTDANGIESNTLRTTIAVPASTQASWPPATVTVAATAEDGGSDWIEFTSLEERFTTVFPGKPTVTETPWLSQFGAVLPARVYSVTQGQSRYVITVVDYRPVERVQVEKARACPDGANTCQGIPDWGIGYWKNDIRGAIVYGMSKFLMRDAKVTEIIWNGIALVQGQALQLTNADKSQTFVGVYMHDNRLVVVEATVPASHPAPVAFTESLGWIDERGRAVRYQTMYVNMPDVPKPAPR